MNWLNATHLGDCRRLMRTMAADGVRVQCVVTSPPYWGLRDYGVAGALGLERTWQRHVAAMRGVFRLVRELLTKDGVLWLNYGDSYYTPRLNTRGVGGNSTINGTRTQDAYRAAQRRRANRHGGQTGIKPKDLVGMPWRVAFALQADGWYLRSDVVWAKPNPMPESIRDRPTKSHEYVFLLTRSEHYRYDAKAIAEPSSDKSHPRVGQVKVQGWAEGKGSHSPKDHARAKAGLKDSTKFGRGAGWRVPGSFGHVVTDLVEERNVRTVWTFPTQPFSGAHFATFPEELVARCVLSGSRPGDIVFDPFMGSGTVAKVATDLGRQFIGCELSAEYLKLHELRRTTMGMPL